MRKISFLERKLTWRPFHASVLIAVLILILGVQVLYFFYSKDRVALASADGVVLDETTSPLVFYNLGVKAFTDEKYNESVAFWQKVLQSEEKDRSLQLKSNFNLGIQNYRLADEAFSKDSLPESLEFTRKTLGYLRESYRLLKMENPDPELEKVILSNYELALQKYNELKNKLEGATPEEDEYKLALKLLEELIGKEKAIQEQMNTKLKGDDSLDVQALKQELKNNSLLFGRLSEILLKNTPQN